MLLYLTAIGCVLLAACDGVGPTPTPTPTPTSMPRPTAAVADRATTVAPPALRFPLLAPEHDALTRDADGLAVGPAHACILRAPGEVWCWGRNAHGELGDGTREDRAAPVRVAGIPPAVELAVGLVHTCARDRGGDVWCWGSNELGQIDAGERAHGRAPIVVFRDAERIAADRVTTCARARGGAVRCRGSFPAAAASETGPAGQLATFLAPVSMPPSLGLPMAVEVSRMCMVGADDTVTCWGERGGAVGEVHGERFAPTRVAGLGRVSALTAGNGLVCAAAADRVACWGPHVSTYLGGSAASPESPVTIPGFGASAYVTSGDGYVCALTSAGTARCAGYGELVDRDGRSVSLTESAAWISALGAPTRMAMSTQGGCAIAGDGALRCVLWRSPGWDQPPPPPAASGPR